jgi:putative two-component system response regulator
VTVASGVRPEPAPLDILRTLQPTAAKLDRREFAESISPLLSRFQALMPSEERAAVAEGVVAFCRHMYGIARSGDALPLAQGMLAQAILADDPVLERRASTMCGLLCGDTVDIVGAIAYHSRALALAESQAGLVDQATAWTNIGVAFSTAGNDELAVRCWRRAVATVEPLPGSPRVRYTACCNLAHGLFQLGEIDEGLRFATRALALADPAWVAADPGNAILIRRTIVWLLIAAGRTAEAKDHVAATAELAARAATPRALIAAGTTRATYEIAVGQTDIALTRLEDSLARARSVPAALRDALSCMVRAEEAAGHPERALLRLQELSDHFYRIAVDRARDHLELSALCETSGRAGESLRELARVRLVSHLRPPGEPEGWKALQRMNVAAVLRMDSTGWHGLRVGALTRALALACGVAPLQALEIGLAAELHDIGLGSVPERILARHGPWNDTERALAERHTEAGAEILRDDSHPRVLMAREIARYHHARWDGTGYPERVGGRFIPLPARMCAVADAYDAMVCGLDGERPRTMQEALEELRRGAGSQFDPALVERFEAVIRDETADRGIDPSITAGLESFQELVDSLQDDRGFL